MKRRGEPRFESSTESVEDRVRRVWADVKSRPDWSTMSEDQKIFIYEGELGIEFPEDERTPQLLEEVSAAQRDITKEISLDTQLLKLKTETRNGIRGG